MTNQEQLIKLAHTKMPFGKYKGRSVMQVLKTEPQYYDWMMRGDFPLHTKKKLTELFNRTLLKKV